MGRPKQLVELDGRPLVQRVVATCVDSQAGPVGVVLGSGAAAVAEALGELRVAHIVNDDWQQGIASSIRAGVRWAQTTTAGALLIVLADQPLLGAAHIAALRDAWLAGAPIVASRFEGVAAAPAMFDRSQWPALLQLEGDQGAGRLLRTDGVTAIDWVHGAIDVDTPDDVRTLEDMHAASPRTNARDC
jgi:CTP:molybdopterin cytidylyltransferase MocA